MANSKISALTSATTPLAGTETLPIVQSSATTKVTVANLTAGRAVSATQYTSTVATGTAPLVVSSTTNVANLNASSLGGATFAAPGAIGGGTASAITGTTITGTDATDATSTTAAALKTAGGLAVVKKMYIGDNVVIGTSGKGIDFSIVTHAGSTSKLLADYEIGTWTPAEATISLSSSVGHYTKIGNQVTAWADMLWPATADVNNVVINGLPFATANAQDARSAFVTFCNAALLLSGTGAMLPQINSTQSQLYRADGNRATNANMTTADIRATWVYYV